MLIKRRSILGSDSLHTAYRPYTTKEMIGNEATVALLGSYLDRSKLPHAMLFMGPAGCGKTTAARIVALGLNCTNIKEMETSTSKPCLECDACLSILAGNCIDVREINVGKDGGKHDVAAVVDDLASAPFSSRVKVVIFDEAHALTKSAKDLLLKEMEDCMEHVYIIFCTNQPKELESKKPGGNPFLDRCSKMRFNALTTELVREMLVNVLEFEGEVHNDDVLDYIVGEARGIPRNALVMLNDVINEGSWDIQVAKNIAGTLVDEDDPIIKDLCLALGGPDYKKACEIYAKLSKTMTAESVRVAVTGWFVACLKRSTNIGPARKYSAMVTELNHPIFQTGKPADHTFYNMMFKVVDIVKSGK